jgi:hypothetical protein
MILNVSRFDQWVGSLASEDVVELAAETLLPPLDILMVRLTVLDVPFSDLTSIFNIKVWHTYMLNPRWYAEDSERIPSVGILYALGNYCMMLMVRCTPSTSDHNS